MTAPTITVNTPAGLLSSKNATVSVTITDGGSVELVTILATYPALGLTECIWHDGQFYTPFKGSTQNSFDFVLRRTGGWPGDVNIQVTAVDDEGNITGRAPAGGAWHPTDLNPEGYWESTAGITLSGSEVTLWENQGTAGSVADFTPFGANAGATFIASDPDFNSQPVLSFDGATTSMATDPTGSWWGLSADGDDLTIATLFINDEPGTTNRIFFSTASPSARGGFTVTLQPLSNRIVSQLWYSGGSPFLTFTSNPHIIDTKYVYAMRHEGEPAPTNDSTTGRLNGAPAGSGNTNGGTLGPSVDSELFLGAGTTGAPTGLVRVAFLFWKKGLLSAADEANFANYINNTFGSPFNSVSS